MPSGKALSMFMKGRYVVITAELVPEAKEVEAGKLEREIREEVGKILKVTISREHVC